MVKRKSMPVKAPGIPIKNEGKHKREYTKWGNKDFKVSVSTLRDIKKLQTSTKLCIPEVGFCRLIREILMECGSSEHRVQVEALLALQEASEIY
ncbi:hypothetical protein NQ317_002981 [Molorchus minor]|uniref:Core Histone H2A/H2B/H3 domain-containing protein n=1 Tax=Molorchus minor TaxID=1323400 RepID=A0ABQ9J7Z6_9CUCU|nr:hypothetical protein NQ317_002981 [Molorchus minor]